VPLPLHVSHGSVIRFPSPPQAGQVRWTLKNPALCMTTPRPLQLRHASGALPGLEPEPVQVLHSSSRMRSIFFSVPRAASRKSISISTRRLVPMRGPRRPRPTLKKSPNDPPSPPKMSPKLRKMSSNEAPSKSRVAYPFRPSWPNWSYCLRFTSSESTSYAWEICLNFCSASLSPGLRSGWCLSASVRNALRISSGVAVRATPRSS
jgi:hypothetical protein